MPKLDVALRGLLDELAAAKKAKRTDARHARAVALKVSKERTKLKDEVKAISSQLNDHIRRRIWMRGKQNLNDAECESFHGQVWRDLQTSIDQTYSNLTTAHIRLELFNKEHPT